jgi:hypothetical protein
MTAICTRVALTPHRRQQQRVAVVLIDDAHRDRGVALELHGPVPVGARRRVDQAAGRGSEGGGQGQEGSRQLEAETHDIRDGQ